MTIVAHWPRIFLCFGGEGGAEGAVHLPQPQNNGSIIPHDHALTIKIYNYNEVPTLSCEVVIYYKVRDAIISLNLKKNI